jgi:hypothetical protein
VVPTLTGVAADIEAGPALAGPANGKVIFCHLSVADPDPDWIRIPIGSVDLDLFFFSVNFFSDLGSPTHIFESLITIRGVKYALILRQLV